jgi:5'-nucleotidase
MSLLLLSNDDGVNAPGLEALRQALAQDHEVVIIAPDRDKSGVSNCLTLDRPLQVLQLEPGRYAVDGTPTDCIHLGTAGIFIEEPQRVVSGINFGANLGDDVLYSGTVAAAMEGRFLQKPALALSLVVTDYSEVNIDRFRVAAAIAQRLLQLVDRLQLPARTVLNVNIPDLPVGQIKGLRMTTLGQRLRGENPISTRNPRGKTLYWIGRAGGPVERVPGSDFHAVEHGYVSITPLHADMCSRDAMQGALQSFSALAAEFEREVGK